MASRNIAKDVDPGISGVTHKEVEEIIKVIEPLYMEYGSMMLLLAVGRLLREPAESAASLETVGEIIERLAMWEI